MKLKTFMSFTFLLLSLIVRAQQLEVRGEIIDDTGVPLFGATVIIEGTARGTQTDENGTFFLREIPQDAVLKVSYIGYLDLRILVNNRSYVEGVMLESQTNLDEVVLVSVGYGKIKSKDLTSAMTTVKSEDIELTPVAQAMQSLQGKVSGLQIVNTGGPGHSPTVRLRGVGSYNGGEASPLYVVDGMFFDNIDFLNTSDIAYISVLKDASAAAIYGVRAANGVVLIETKSGTPNKKPEIIYNAYAGYQVAQNVLRLANAEQFTTIVVESGSESNINFIQKAMQRYGRSRINPNIPNVNTDWYQKILRPAMIQNHSIGVTGSNKKTTYAIGGSYFMQEGILKMKNEYERFNLRTKLSFDVNDWLTISSNAVISNATRYDPENSAFRLAYFAIPILPVLDPSLTKNSNVFPKNYANAQDLGYRGGQNPFPTMDLSENRSRIKNTIINFAARIQIIPKKLSFKTAYNYSFTADEYRGIRLPYFVGSSFQRENASLFKRKSSWLNKIWDNTITFTDSYGENNITLLAGTSFRDESFNEIHATGLNFPLFGEESYYLSQSQKIVKNSVGDGASRNYGLSYFGRLSYNYDSRYLIYGTFRADGTNKYQEKWGYFPTIGVGWLVSGEHFMEFQNVFDFLKLRASWGELGNDKVASSSGSVSSSVVKTALGDKEFSGLSTNSDYTSLKWEVIQETNIGLSARLLNNNLSVEMDYYIRDTQDAVIPVERALIPGSIRKNIGKIRNSGFETSLNWDKKVSENFSYTTGINFSLLSNEILGLGGANHLNAGTAEFLQRSIVGSSIYAFYGREVAGVYQNDAEVQSDPVAVENKLVPGDFKYRDVNGDGKINDDDRVVLGSFLPSYIFGFNFGINYKQLDFSFTASGQGGNKILNRKRGEVIFTNDTNIDRDFAINRWHGEGTSNRYPSAAGIRKGWNQKMSDFFVEDGDFFRIQNVTLGYTLKKVKKASVRLYFTAEKPLTLFKYNGFNPEVSSGVDNETYPIPAVYTLGINIKI